MFLDRPVRFFLPLSPCLSPSGATVLKVLALDREGRPVADGRDVSLRPVGGQGAVTSTTDSGKASFTVEGHTGGFIVSSGDAVDTLRFDLGEAPAPVIGLVVDGTTGRPVPGAQVRLTGGTTVTGGPRGFVRSSGGAAEGTVYARGYEPAPLTGPGGEPAGEETAVPVTALTPLYGGVLHGRTIVIDPAGGGTDDAGRGEGALRGATVNMRLARELEKLLYSGGASVQLTRRGEEPLSSQQRIFGANRAGADLAVGIRFGLGGPEAGGCVIYHYPGSVQGTAAADSIAAGISGTPPCESFATSDSSDLFLQQTNCPAVIISGGDLSDTDTEKILGSPRWVRLEAEAILRGLLAHFRASG
jgi:N-acetylmuramoyl-L-alanine amidase